MSGSAKGISKAGCLTPTLNVAASCAGWSHPWVQGETQDRHDAYFDNILENPEELGCGGRESHRGVIQLWE